MPGDDDFSSKGLFRSASNGRAFDRRRQLSTIDRFALELAKHDIATGDKGGNVAECSRRLGIKPANGNALLQRIRQRLGPQAI